MHYNVLMMQRPFTLAKKSKKVRFLHTMRTEVLQVLYMQISSLKTETTSIYIYETASRDEMTALF